MVNFLLMFWDRTLHIEDIQQLTSLYSGSQPEGHPLNGPKMNLSGHKMIFYRQNSVIFLLFLMKYWTLLLDITLFEGVTCLKGCEPLP